MITFASPLHHQLKPGLQKIEVWSTMAIPTFKVVGLPGQEIIESCERVRAAIDASGLEFPKRRVLVNLSPAGIRKHGTGTDLAIALAVIASAGTDTSVTKRMIVASGELALDGSVRSAGRVLRTVVAAREAGATDLIFSSEDKPAALRALELLGLSENSPQLSFISTLADALPVLTIEMSVDYSPIQSVTSIAPYGIPRSNFIDLLPLGSATERLLLVAIAGRHHLLLLGPKGTGKTACLNWLEPLAGRLERQELLDRLLLRELVDPHLEGGNWNCHAPIRRVSPQVRPEALVGGVQRGEIRPGEFSLAHGGILIADEFLEWPRDSREALRDPMESGRVHLNRAQLSAELPARFQLAATANLCRCGGWPPSLHRLLEQDAELPVRATPCRCPISQKQEYLSRLSGPILDRIDLVHPVLTRPAKAGSIGGGSCSLTEHAEALAERLEKTQARLRARWGQLPGRLSGGETEALLRAEPALERAWSEGPRRSEVSLRRRHKEIRVALTLAALDSRTEAPLPLARHLLEARSFSAEDWIRALDSTELTRSLRAQGRVDPESTSP